MKKILLILTILILISSCWLPPSEEEKKEIVEKKIIEQKKVLITQLKEETIERIKKFDKNNTRSKIESMTWFLCYDELITHPATWISLNAKNCKHEKNTDEVYFKIKWNSIYKVVNTTEDELIMIWTNKIEKDTMWNYIANNIISQFKNILDKKDCRYRKLVKNDILSNNTDNELYTIEPIWFYKVEIWKQLKKDPNTTVCEWYYPWLKKFFIYNSTKPKYFLHILWKDNLINYDSIKFN